MCLKEITAGLTNFILDLGGTKTPGKNLLYFEMLLTKFTFFYATLHFFNHLFEEKLNLELSEEECFCKLLIIRLGTARNSSISCKRSESGLSPPGIEIEISITLIL